MNKKTMFKNFLKWITFVLCVLPLSAAAQVLNTPTAESPVHFANTTDFSVGTLTITFQLGGGQTTAKVEVTLPQGVEYAGSVTASGGGATVAHQAGSPATKPVFNVTAAAGSSVTLAVKRKVVAAVMSNTTALRDGFEDTVALIINGSTVATKTTPKYQLKSPTLVVQQPESVQANAMGTHTKTFTIRNTGLGIVKDVYFSITYPANVTSNGVWNGSTKLTPVTLWGKTVYKVPNANLGNNQTITITENYTVRGCAPNRQIKYESHWGTSAQIFETKDASKTLNIDTGKPLINIDRGNNSSYFTWGDGLAGNKLGTFTVRYFNSGTGDNPTASKIKIKLFERHTGIFDSHKPENFRLVYTDGGVEKEIPILLPLLANQWLIKL